MKKNIGRIIMRINKSITRSKVTDLPIKMCNLCGEMTVVYQVISNSPICFTCVPKDQTILKKKIPSESKMVQAILDNSK